MHKTQGSEFGATFVVLTNPYWLLSRELLYTALTATRTGWSSCTRTRWARLRPSTVEFPDHESVALPQGAQVAVESRSVVAYAGSEVVVVLITAAMGYTWSGIFGLIAPSVCRLVFSSMEGY